jgi:hypothetical protein
MFSITSASTTDILATIGNVSSGLWILIALLIGIPIAFYLIEVLINLVPRRGEDVYETGYYAGQRAGERRIGYQRGYQMGEAIGETHKRIL